MLTGRSNSRRPSSICDARGVKDCWFVYFGEGVIPYQYYGIPCKALPTPDALWMDEKFYDVPAEIDGPVLISGGNLSGFEYGPAELNPYAQFQTLEADGGHSARRVRV